MLKETLYWVFDHCPGLRDYGAHLRLRHATSALTMATDALQQHEERAHARIVAADAAIAKAQRRRDAHSHGRQRSETLRHNLGKMMTEKL